MWNIPGTLKCLWAALHSLSGNHLISTSKSFLPSKGTSSQPEWVRTNTWILLYEMSYWTVEIIHIPGDTSYNVCSQGTFPWKNKQNKAMKVSFATLRTLTFYQEILSIFSSHCQLCCHVLCFALYPFLHIGWHIWFDIVRRSFSMCSSQNKERKNWKEWKWATSRYVPLIAAMNLY